jgi:hypothetical protein
MSAPEHPGASPDPKPAWRRRRLTSYQFHARFGLTNGRKSRHMLAFRWPVGPRLGTTRAQWKYLETNRQPNLAKSFGEMAEWPKAPDSKSGLPKGNVGSTPTLSSDKTERCPSGRRGMIGNHVYGNVPWVRLPLSPPNPREGRASDSRGGLAPRGSLSGATLLTRGGRNGDFALGGKPEGVEHWRS